MIATNLMVPTYPKDHPAFATAQIILSSLFIALCAQISIPLPFSPVPLTLQTFAVMLVGAKLGSRKGAIAVLLYLAEAILGLPVLAGGMADPLALAGPKGGYLIGFVFQASFSGWLVERINIHGKRFLTLGLFLNYALLLITGSLWLSQFVGIQNAFTMGALPFIPGAIIKIFVVVALLTRNESHSAS